MNKIARYILRLVYCNNVGIINIYFRHDLMEVVALQTQNDQNPTTQK